jgi:hypothetical protein
MSVPCRETEAILGYLLSSQCWTFGEPVAMHDVQARQKRPPREAQTPIMIPSTKMVPPCGPVTSPTV